MKVDIKRYGRAVRKARNRLGLSLRAASLKMGIGKSTLRFIEVGQSNGSINTFQQIEKFLGVPVPIADYDATLEPDYLPPAEEFIKTKRERPLAGFADYGNIRPSYTKTPKQRTYTYAERVERAIYRAERRTA